MEFGGRTGLRERGVSFAASSDREGDERLLASGVRGRGRSRTETGVEGRNANCGLGAFVDGSAGEVGGGVEVSRGTSDEVLEAKRRGCSLDSDSNDWFPLPLSVLLLSLCCDPLCILPGCRILSGGDSLRPLSCNAELSFPEFDEFEGECRVESVAGAERGTGGKSARRRRLVGVTEALPLVDWVAVGDWEELEGDLEGGVAADCM